MKVILTENIEFLGKIGEIVEVKDGYGRNCLIPKNLAIFADYKNISLLEYTKKLVEVKKKKNLKDAQSLANKIESISLTIAKKVGENEKLFGSVTDTDIVNALLNEQVTINKKTIELTEPIKTLGVFTIPIKLSPEVTANLKLWVVSDSVVKSEEKTM
jgi:large subunit ribosomal protein L9